ncbi:MAG: monofunctional biosynthetic peptidoglycan transglycosylase [Candidatus Thiodiazotropha sp. (ex Dulcina madagascariensis)]|nr:monofunctional biosynthetic peptidoglycan transglycosylase [Candidatus Thiodiazotropha sp. (ex Dulcina madagascariensis)]
MLFARQRGGMIRRLLRGLVLLLTGSGLLLIAVIFLLRYVDPPFWSWMIQRELDPPGGYPAQYKHRWLDLERITPAMQLAVVASEDQRFPHHHGIDFDAIENALRESGDGAALRGASTLTQQTAKNLFLWQDRDWSRKLLEGGLALMLELLWDKRRILEVYLNIVEFGPGVYGVGAASEYWFQVSADRLTVNQAARLAAILPNPWRYRAEPPTPYVAKRAKWIERQMDRLGYVWMIPVSGW